MVLALESVVFESYLLGPPLEVADFFFSTPGLTVVTLLSNGARRIPSSGRNRPLQAD